MKLAKKEQEWADKGFRYWGTAKYESGKDKGGESVIATVDVLDKPPGREFYFSNPTIRAGEPIVVDRAGNLDIGIKRQLCNTDKIRKGWNPCQTGQS